MSRSCCDRFLKLGHQGPIRVEMAHSRLARTLEHHNVIPFLQTVKTHAEEAFFHGTVEAREDHKGRSPFISRRREKISGKLDVLEGDIQHLPVIIHELGRLAETSHAALPMLTAARLAEERQKVVGAPSMWRGEG